MFIYGLGTLQVRVPTVNTVQSGITTFGAIREHRILRTKKEHFEAEMA